MQDGKVITGGDYNGMGNYYDGISTAAKSGDNVILLKSEFDKQIKSGGTIAEALVVKANPWRAPLAGYYEDRTINFEKIKERISVKYGGYPVKRNFLWHDGIHLAGSKNEQILNIGPGRLIAARLVEKEENKAVNGSTCLILMEYAYKTEQDLKKFYALYNHLAPFEHTDLDKIIKKYPAEEYTDLPWLNQIIHKQRGPYFVTARDGSKTYWSQDKQKNNIVVKDINGNPLTEDSDRLQTGALYYLYPINNPSLIYEDLNSNSDLEDLNSIDNYKKGDSYFFYNNGKICQVDQCKVVDDESYVKNLIYNIIKQHEPTFAVYRKKLESLLEGEIVFFGGINSEAEPSVVKRSLASWKSYFSKNNGNETAEAIRNTIVDLLSLPFESITDNTGPVKIHDINDLIAKLKEKRKEEIIESRSNSKEKIADNPPWQSAAAQIMNIEYKEKMTGIAMADLYIDSLKGLSEHKQGEKICTCIRNLMDIKREDIDEPFQPNDGTILKLLDRYYEILDLNYFETICNENRSDLVIEIAPGEKIGMMGVYNGTNPLQENNVLHLGIFSDENLLAQENDFTTIGPEQNPDALLDSIEMTNLFQNAGLPLPVNGKFSDLGIVMGNEMESFLSDLDNPLNKIICTHVIEGSNKIKWDEELNKAKGIYSKKMYHLEKHLKSNDDRLNSIANETGNDKYIKYCFTPFAYFSDELVEAMDQKDSTNLKNHNAVFYHPMEFLKVCEQKKG